MGFLPGGCNSLDRKDKQAQVLPGPIVFSPPEKTSKRHTLLPRALKLSLDRKDKQALAIRVLLAQAACLFADWKNKQEANTTGNGNVAVGQGTGRLSEKTSKPWAAGSRALILSSEKTSKRLFNDL